MNSSSVYKFLTERVTEIMQAEYDSWKKTDRAAKTLINYGMRDSKRIPSRENVLLTLVRKAICYTDKKMFLASDDSQSIYAYNGKYFEKIEGRADKFLKELIRRVFIGMNIGLTYQTDVAGMIARECVETLTSSDEYLYNPDRRYVAFDNGIFDVEKGKLKDFDVKYRPYIALDIPYTPAKDLYIEYDKQFGISRDENPAKLWEWKIAEIIPNKDMRDAFQMFCGSLLADREKLKIEYCCFLIGSGSNGKSVLASVVAAVFGERYFSRFTPKQLFKDSDARVNIAALQGKICNLVGDLDSSDFAGGDFKRFASGEKFQGRRNYKDPIQVTAPPLLCCTNSMPDTSDDSWGHHRRQLPVYTTAHQFTEEDKDPYLTEKLSTPEARAFIFCWIYEGYRKIIRNGGNIKFGEDVLQAMRELQDDSTSARRWFRDQGYEAEEDPEAEGAIWKTAKSLYEEYKIYADECGYGNPLKFHELTAMLRSKGCASKRLTTGINYRIRTKKTIDIQ